MKIELRNVKYAAFASEETACFQATVYIDGVKAGDAHNDGHGGMTFISPHALEQRLAAHAATLPHRVLELDEVTKTTVPQTADSLIDDLLSDWLIERDVRRALKNRIVWEKHDGSVVNTNTMKADALAAALKRPDLTKALRDCKRVLNLMPIPEAVAVFRAACK